MSKLPPPRQLQPVITALTEWLARCAAGQLEPRAWTPDEWRYARVLAHIHGIAPLLHVRGAGALGDVAWRDFLAAQHERNTGRNGRVLQRVVALRNAATLLGVPLLPLKGSALLTWLYDDIGLRPMSDIDVLTTPDGVERAIRAVESIGYTREDDIPRHISFIMPPNRVVDVRGEHPDNPIKLELHTRISNPMPRKQVDISSLFLPSLTLVDQSVSPSVQMLHLLQHAHYHLLQRGLRLIGLFDLHLLAQRLTEAEWRDVLAHVTHMHGETWAYVPLALCQRYFGGIPAQLLNTLHPLVPVHIRRLARTTSIADVSYSNLSPQYAWHVVKWSNDTAEGLLWLFERGTGVGTQKDIPKIKPNKALHVFAPLQTYYRRGLRWFNPRAYRTGTEQLLSE